MVAERGATLAGDLRIRHLSVMARDSSPRGGGDYKLAGYLRVMPASGTPHVAAHFALRAAWNRLARAGLAEALEGLYRRTPAGDEALSAYDAGLGPDDLRVLSRVRDEPKAMQGDYALHRLVGAGLVRLGVKSNGIPEITAAGLAIVGVARGGAVP